MTIFFFLEPLLLCASIFMASSSLNHMTKFNNRGGRRVKITTLTDAAAAEPIANATFPSSNPPLNTTVIDSCTSARFPVSDTCMVYVMEEEEREVESNSSSSRNFHIRIDKSYSSSSSLSYSTIILSEEDWFWLKQTASSIDAVIGHARRRRQLSVRL